VAAAAAGSGQSAATLTPVEDSEVEAACLGAPLATVPDSTVGAAPVRAASIWAREVSGGRGKVDAAGSGSGAATCDGDPEVCASCGGVPPTVCVLANVPDPEVKAAPVRAAPLWAEGASGGCRER